MWLGDTHRTLGDARRKIKKSAPVSALPCPCPGPRSHGDRGLGIGPIVASWWLSCIVMICHCLLSIVFFIVLSVLSYFIMICHDSVIQWRKHWETCQIFKCAQVQMRLKCNPNAVPLKLQSCDSSLVNSCRIWTLNCRRLVKSVQLWRDPGFPQRHVALSSNNFPYTYKMIKMRTGWVFIASSSQ